MNPIDSVAMRLRVLGANGTYPSPGRPGSGFVVEHGPVRVWLDAGPCTFAALWSELDPDDLDAVIVSHRHPDHSIDLLSAYHAFAFGRLTRRRIPVFTTADAIAALRNFAGSDGDTDHPLEQVFDFRPTVGGAVETIGDVTVRFAETTHSVPNLACRFEAGGKVLVYTGDTGPAGDWTALADGAHVLVSEASLQDGSQPFEYHLTAREAGQIARSRRVQRLVLSHVPPHLDPAVSIAECESTFDRPVTLAVPGAVIDV